MVKKQVSAPPVAVVTAAPVHPAFEKFMYFIAIAIPLMTVPQIITVWGSQSAENISLSTWLAYLFSAACWLAHSVMTKNRTLVINQTLWVALESILVVGILLYR